MTSEQNFFQELLLETKKAFSTSPIFAEQKELGKIWNYSICGSPVQKGKGVLLGINWGVSGDHEPQTEMPDGNDIPSYNFIQRSRPYLEKYLVLDLATVNFNYTNLCFFRSPHELFLTPLDYENSIPLFKKFIDFVNPPWIFSLGNINTKMLLQFGLLTEVQEYYDSEKKHKGVYGKLWGFPFYSVPHPNARLKTNSRDEIWKQIGEEVLKVTEKRYR